jgi:hypothetical protein
MGQQKRLATYERTDSMSTKDFKKPVRRLPVPDKKTHVTDPVNFFIINFKTCGALISKPV